MLVRSGEPRERLPTGAVDGTGALDGVVDRPRVPICRAIEVSVPCEAGVDVVAELFEASDEDAPGRWSGVSKASTFAASPDPLIGPGDVEGVADVGVVMRYSDVDPLVVWSGEVKTDEDGASDCLTPLEIFVRPLLSEEGPCWKASGKG